MSYHTFFALAASEKTSLWQDLMNYFNDSTSFENIGSGTGTLFSLPLLATLYKKFTGKKKNL